MAFAQPAIRGRDRFEPLLWPTAMRRSTFQSKNGQNVLTQVLKPEGGERLADAHHVGFGDADVQRAPSDRRRRRPPRARWSWPDRNRSRRRADRGRRPSSPPSRFRWRHIPSSRSSRGQQRRRRSESACRAAARRRVSTGPTTGGSDQRRRETCAVTSRCICRRGCRRASPGCASPSGLSARLDENAAELAHARRAAACAAAPVPARSAASGTVTLCLFRKSESAPCPFVAWQMIAVGRPLRGP